MSTPAQPTYDFIPLKVEPDVNEAFRQIAEALIAIIRKMDQLETRIRFLEES